jgi:hypothetical protein
MPETIHCVHCKAPLRLPVQFIGQEVRCPSCQATFTAQLPAAATPPIQPQPEEPPRDEPPPTRRDDDYRPSRRPRPGDDDDDDYPRPRRSYDDDYGRGRGREPHRGGTILTLGILSIVFAFCCYLLGLGMAIPAIVMANNDLGRIRSGDMDPNGEGQINSGRTCAIVGLVLSVIMAILHCGAIGVSRHH